jgi:hypothetical protein
MRRFFAGVGLYVAACLIAVTVILVRGVGPHPQILSFYPSSGDLYWPGGTAQITFSHPMDESSVERALQVTPGSQGQAAWFGDTLNLQPVGDWKPGVTYHILLTGTINDDQGRSLHTPVSWWFRVHHIGRVAPCPVAGVRNVCEVGGTHRPLTHSAMPVTGYALSPDGTLLAYTRIDGSGLPHLFIIGADGTGARQLSSGAYADGDPTFAAGDNSSVTYRRRPVLAGGRPGRSQLWNVNIDGSNNAKL